MAAIVQTLEGLRKESSVLDIRVPDDQAGVGANAVGARKGAVGGRQLDDCRIMCGLPREGYREKYEK